MLLICGTKSVRNQVVRMWFGRVGVCLSAEFLIRRAGCLTCLRAHSLPPAQPLWKNVNFMQSNAGGKAISGKGCGLFLYRHFLCVFMHGYAFLCCVMQRKIGVLWRCKKILPQGQGAHQFAVRGGAWAWIKLSTKKVSTIHIFLARDMAMIEPYLL